MRASQGCENIFLTCQSHLLLAPGAPVLLLLLPLFGCLLVFQGGGGRRGRENVL